MDAKNHVMVLLVPGCSRPLMVIVPRYCGGSVAIRASAQPPTIDRLGPVDESGPERHPSPRTSTPISGTRLAANMMKVAEHEVPLENTYGFSREPAPPAFTKGRRKMVTLS